MVSSRKTLYNILNKCNINYKGRTFKNYVGRGPSLLKPIVGNKIELSAGQARFFNYFIKQIQMKCKQHIDRCTKLVNAVNELKRHVGSATSLDEISYTKWLAELKYNTGDVPIEIQQIWNSFVILGNVSDWKKLYKRITVKAETGTGTKLSVVPSINWNEVWCRMQKIKLINAVYKYISIPGRIGSVAIELFKKNIVITDKNVFNQDKLSLVTTKIAKLTDKRSDPHLQSPDKQTDTKTPLQSPDKQTDTKTPLRRETTQSISVPDKTLVKTTTTFIKTDTENIYDVNVSIQNGYDITIIPNQVVGMKVGPYFADLIGQTSPEDTLSGEEVDVITTMDTTIDDDETTTYTVNISIPKNYRIEIISGKTVGSQLNDWLSQFHIAT